MKVNGVHTTTPSSKLGPCHSFFDRGRLSFDQASSSPGSASAPAVGGLGTASVEANGPAIGPVESLSQLSHVLKTRVDEG